MSEHLTTDRHCSLGERAWTELVTNNTLLSGVDVERHLVNLMVPGEFPWRGLPAFLHEGVHHWCFQSPVGSTLALLQLRARRGVISLAAGEAGNEFDVLEDVIRHETAVSLLRPLAEGLALFAEYDVTPTPCSQVMSLPMRAVYLNFTKPSPEELSSRFGFSLYKLLWEVRRSDFYVRRKMDLLLQPISCAHGGYLAGYLTVKNLWHFATSRCERFADPDLFLMYLRSFFYDDFGLVATLLDSSTAEISSVNAISAYIQRRFQSFFEATFESDIDDFERAVCAMKFGERPTNLPRFSTSLSRYDLGKRLLESLVDELKADKLENMGDLMRIMDSWTLAQRDIMCIGSLNVSVTMPRPGRVVAKRLERIVCAGPTLEDVDQADGDGAVEIYLSPSGGYRVFAILLGQKIVALLFFGDVHEKEREQFMSYRLSRAEVDANNDAAHQLLHAFISQKVISIVYSHVDEYNQQIPDQVYLPKALLHVPDDQIDSCINLMQNDGLLPLLKGDLLLLKALAILGLSYSLNLTRSELVKSFSTYDMDLDHSLEQLKRCGEISNIPLVADLEDQILCLV